MDGKLYWSDREGMRVMRARARTLGNGASALLWMLPRTKVYWTQKGRDNAGEGRIFRANVDIPPGQMLRPACLSLSASDRTWTPVRCGEITARDQKICGSMTRSTSTSSES